MPVSGSALIDRVVQLEVLTNAARAEAHDIAQCLFQPGLVATARAMQIDIDRQRLRNADGVGKLDGAAISQFGCDNVLGKIPGRIGRRTVHRP